MNSHKLSFDGMGKRRRSHSRDYHAKVPPFKPDPEHWTRKGVHGWKQKVAYDNEDAAYEFLKQCPKLMAAGYRVYQCKVCQKWHIGHLHNEEIK